MELNVDLAPAWFDSLDALFAVLNSGTGDVEAATQVFIEATYDFFRAQPGFENFPESPELRAIEGNEDFFILTDQALSLANAIPSDPQPSSVYFQEQSAANFANYLNLWTKVRLPVHPSAFLD